MVLDMAFFPPKKNGRCSDDSNTGNREIQGLLSVFLPDPLGK